MFADDTNLFFTHENIRYLFQTVNKKLENINQWFISKKLSLNIKKTKNSFFHKAFQKEDNLLLSPKLVIKNYETKWTESIRFSCVLLDGKLSWKEHIKYTENKKAKTS